MPGPVLAITSPVGEVDRMGQLEDDGPLARLDHHRHKRAIPVGLGRLGAYPSGHHGTRGPEHDHGLRLAERALDAFVERLA